MSRHPKYPFSYVFADYSYPSLPDGSGTYEVEMYKGVEFDCKAFSLLYKSPAVAMIVRGVVESSISISSSSGYTMTFSLDQFEEMIANNSTPNQTSQNSSKESNMTSSGVFSVPTTAGSIPNVFKYGSASRVSGKASDYHDVVLLRDMKIANGVCPAGSAFKKCYVDSHLGLATFTSESPDSYSCLCVGFNDLAKDWGSPLLANEFFRSVFDAVVKSYEYRKQTDITIGLIHPIINDDMASLLGFELNKPIERIDFFLDESRKTVLVSYQGGKEVGFHRLVEQNFTFHPELGHIKWHAESLRGPRSLLTLPIAYGKAEGLLLSPPPAVSCTYRDAMLTKQCRATDLYEASDGRDSHVVLQPIPLPSGCLLLRDGRFRFSIPNSFHVHEMTPNMIQEAMNPKSVEAVSSDLQASQNSSKENTEPMLTATNIVPGARVYEFRGVKTSEAFRKKHSINVKEWGEVAVWQNQLDGACDMVRCKDADGAFGLATYFSGTHPEIVKDFFSLLSVESQPQPKFPSFNSIYSPKTTYYYREEESAKTEITQVNRPMTPDPVIKEALQTAAKCVNQAASKVSELQPELIQLPFTWEHYSIAVDGRENPTWKEITLYNVQVPVEFLSLGRSHYPKAVVRLCQNSYVSFYHYIGNKLDVVNDIRLEDLGKFRHLPWTTLPRTDA